MTTYLVQKTRRIERFSNDECGELAEAFNRMTSNLQTSRAELEKAALMVVKQPVGGRGRRGRRRLGERQRQQEDGLCRRG